MVKKLLITGTIIILVASMATPANASRIIFQDDTQGTVTSNSVVVGSDKAGAANTSITFGADAIPTENGNITWNITSNSFAVDHTVNITGDLTVSGTTNFPGTTSDSYTVDSDNSSTSQKLSFGSALTKILEYDTANTWFNLSNRLNIAGAGGVNGIKLTTRAGAGDSNQNQLEVRNSSNTSVFSVTETGNTSLFGLTATGAADFSGTSRFAMRSGAADPGTCTVGDLFFNTTSAALKSCTATNTWTVPSAAGTVTSVNGSGGTTGLSLTGGPITSSGTLTLGGTLGLTNGGTNNNLTASNGGIVFSDASKLNILSGTATAGKVLQSGATAAPTWSTPTYPSGSGSSGTILRSNGTNMVYSTATYPDTAGTAGNILRSDGTNFISTAVTSYQSTPANPTGTASTTGVMMGLAGSITPIRSGIIKITISGDMTNGTNVDGAQVQIRTGTGSAPANQAALTGTARGGLVRMTNPTDTRGGRVTVPFSTNAIVSGLTSGTAYWIDAGLAAITGGTATIANVSISAVEL